MVRLWQAAPEGPELIRAFRLCFTADAWQCTRMAVAELNPRAVKSIADEKYSHVWLAIEQPKLSHFFVNQGELTPMKKLLLIFAALALTVASAADKTTTYKVTLTQPASVNGTTLQPGDYKIQVEGDKAILKTGKTVVEAPAKLQTAEHKFTATSIDYDSTKANPTINEIHIGGTTTRIIFSSSAGQ